MQPGHIIIAYAVGHGNILSVYRVISNWKATGVIGSRWPYFVIGENLTPYYGDKWNKQSLTIGNQKDEVLKKGAFNITPSGKNSYGSLMQGADKLRITANFATYIIDKIETKDRKIAEENG